MHYAGIAGAISRTCTAPVDRLKMLLQIQDGATALTLRGGMQKMAAEGSPSLVIHLFDISSMLTCLCKTHHGCAGTIKAYFRGNGVNVVKIAPETALRLTLNDRIKAVVAKNHLERITPWERMACGGLAGASAQVFLFLLLCLVLLKLLHALKSCAVLYTQRGHQSAILHVQILPSLCLL